MKRKRLTMPVVSGDYGSPEREKALLIWLRQAREELSAIEAQRWCQESAGMVGTFWKYRNCYSMPSKPSDYWFVYRCITKVTDTKNTFVAFDFETDKNGKHIIATEKWTHLTGWVRCTEKEYLRAWRRLVNTIRRTTPTPRAGE